MVVLPMSSNSKEDFTKVILFLLSFLIVVEDINVMMNTLVEANLFTLYMVSQTYIVSISHLEFADDAF